jgi:hypothetical protein
MEFALSLRHGGRQRRWKIQNGGCRVFEAQLNYAAMDFHPAHVRVECATENHVNEVVKRTLDCQTQGQNSFAATYARSIYIE